MHAFPAKSRQGFRMNAADVASATLLLWVTGAGAFVVHRFFGKAKEERQSLARYAQSIAGQRTITPWGRGGHLVGDIGSRTGFCIDVFTQATMRGGVVDIWHVQKESPALRNQRFALVRPNGESTGRFDLEGSKQPAKLIVQGTASSVFGHPAVMASVEALFGSWKIRFFRVENGFLEIGVERVASTITELSLVLDSISKIVAAIEKASDYNFLAPPDPDQHSVGSVSGAPVLVPLVTRRS